VESRKVKVERFEDLLVWQKGKSLVLDVYKIFNDTIDFSFKRQIQRAAISVTNNIAEGFERKSNKELARFLYIAKGSSGEIRSMLYIALELNYITQEEFNHLYQKSEEISKMLFGFIKKINP